MKGDDGVKTGTDIKTRRDKSKGLGAEVIKKIDEMMRNQGKMTLFASISTSISKGNLLI